MRIQKFRAWDKKEKRWIYCHFHPTQLSWASPKYTKQELVKELDGDVAGVAFDNIERWFQFTDSIDKKLNEICEGDILQDIKNKNIKVVVEFCDSCFMVSMLNGGGTYPIYDLDVEFEIIGNITENPEWIINE